jgi:23S rRNA pseudouridine955/2504/2580 synthase
MASAAEPGSLRLTVGTDDAGQRLDRYLRKVFSRVPLSHLYKLIRTGGVLLNGRRAREGTMLSEGDLVQTALARGQVRLRRQEGAEAVIRGKFFREHFRLLHEDEHLLVLDKPAGVLVHSGPTYSWRLSMIDLVKAYLAVRGIRTSASFEPALAHRLDRETSGVLVVAKSALALRGLNRAFRSGAVEKEYRALAWGERISERGDIDRPLHKGPGREGERVRVVASRGGKSALTCYRCQHRFPRAAMLAVWIKTGRTHQIRVHLAGIDHPVVGDLKYGDYRRNRAFLRSGGPPGIFLHARKLSLDHPVTGSRCIWEAAPPASFEAAQNALRDFR